MLSRSLTRLPWLARSRMCRPPLRTGWTTTEFGAMAMEATTEKERGTTLSMQFKVSTNAIHSSLATSSLARMN